MKVSLVTPLRDEEATLAALVESAWRQTRPPDEYVLVDGGSTDGTLALARRLAAADPRLKVVEAGPATPGRGRNVGIEAAAHEWVALADAGLTLEPAWLENLCGAAESDPSADVVYGNYEPITNGWFARCAALAYVPPKVARPTGPARGPSVASMMLRREAWRAVGGFPDLRAAEDLIFMRRLEGAGRRAAWAPRATARWQLQPTFARTFRKFLLYSKHNVWAGQQRGWHYGVARQYAVVGLCVALALAHSAWWLVGVPLWLGARVWKSVWLRREGRGLAWALDPAQLFGVALVLLTIDLATFAGWALALAGRPAGARAS